MSDFGAAGDQSRDEARAKSRGCPHCSGEGMCEVFDPRFDGRRVAERECLVRGEVKRMNFAMVVAAHCVCLMGEWMRSKADVDVRRHIPDLADVLAGRTRWTAADPMGDRPFDPGMIGGGVVHAPGGRPGREV